MDGSIDRQHLLRLTLKMVGEVTKRAEVAIRPHSVAAGDGVGDSYKLGGKYCQLSSKAPPEMELVAMTLQAFDCWEAAIESGDVVTASAAALALGCSVQESRLVALLQRDTGQLIAAARKSREGNRRGGSAGKWTADCERVARAELEKLSRAKLSETAICKRIAAVIKNETGTQIGWPTVKKRLRVLNLLTGHSA